MKSQQIRTRVLGETNVQLTSSMSFLQNILYGTDLEPRFAVGSNISLSQSAVQVILQSEIAANDGDLRYKLR
jgi:hypothetical protein